MSEDHREILTHGVIERRSNNGSWDRLEEEVQRNGYAVIENVLDEQQLADIRQKMAKIYDQQVAEFGAENLEKINDQDIVRTMLAYDDVFAHLVINDKITKIVSKLLKQNFIISSQVGILNRPQAGLYQYAWHRDLQYQHFVCSRPLAIQALFCIDDFTRENGGTYVLPGTHRQEEFPSDEYVRKYALQIQAPAGSALIFDSMLYHRAGVNRSKELRRAINHIYNAPIIHQQINLPNLLKGKYSDNEKLRKVLGYDWGPADNILDWRKQRLDRRNN